MPRGGLTHEAYRKCPESTAGSEKQPQDKLSVLRQEGTAAAISLYNGVDALYTNPVVRPTGHWDSLFKPDFFLTGIDNLQKKPTVLLM